MAQYDVTADAATLTAAGWIDARIEQLHERLNHVGDRWIAYNRGAEYAITSAVGRVKTANARVDKAQEMLDAVKAGRVLFTKAQGAWMIVGPVDTIQAGALVSVTKADGTTRDVIVGTPQEPLTKQGVTYAVAPFSNPPFGDAPSAQARRHGASHGVNGEIWDNA